ncbi:MAG: glycosyltransferase family 4 protein [Armatimonadetes bacterium]|nr:glycosyltransferase family 4 protein [Armatimonadota bacterium]
MAQTLANKIILVAKHLTTEVNPKHHHKMRLLYNAIETSEIEALSQVKIDLSVLPKDNPLVVSLASLLPRKGIHHLVRAAAILSNSLEATFVVAGGEVDKTYSNFVRKLIHDLCPDHFFILPWLPNPYPLLQRAVVAALATVDKPEQVPTDNPDAMPVGEGLPRFILEAMALKKPVVATRVDGCDEAIVDGETGFLVTPANPEAMAEAIRRLLRNPELAKEMGERARQRVEENFSMEKHQKVLAEIYGELLRGG